MSTDLKRIVEAVLFAAETPLSLAQICQVLETKDKAPIETALAELSKEYDFLERAFDLVEVAGGWRLRTRPEMAFWLRKLKRQSTTRLSRASLETLAIIAYKQPVLKAEIERIRGVEVSGVLRMLMEKDLVRVVGRRDLPGRPLIYGTTKRFLEVFDLNDLTDLPTLEEMQDLLGEPDVVREEEREEAPLFTRGMAGQDGEEAIEAETDGEDAQDVVELGQAEDEPTDAESALQDEASEWEEASELVDQEIEEPKSAPIEADDQAESYTVEPAQDQMEAEPVPDQIEPETAEPELAPAFEQPEYQPQAEAEAESVAAAEKAPELSPEQAPEQRQEQYEESSDQGVHYLEPKNEPEDPSGPSGQGSPGGDSGPRAA